MGSDTKQALSGFFSGDMDDSEATLKAYSHDASLLEVRPELVLFPKTVEDIRGLIRFVAEHKTVSPTLSITCRAAGSCMSGGPLNESIILDFSRHMRGTLSIGERSAEVLPGTFYRDFEVETLKHNLILPCYTASKNLCAIGGMIGNNAAGEKTLHYGKMEDYLNSLMVVFADGSEHEVRALSEGELGEKLKLESFEGEIYRKVHGLISRKGDLIASSKPKVSKNSAGYYIWNVWNGKTFDLTKLIVGAQGTLGIVTKANLRLVPVNKHSKLATVFMRDITNLGKLVNDILPLEPESLESYDDTTLSLAFRFFPDMLKTMKVKNFGKLLWSFLPELGMVLTGGLPKLILLIEFAAETEAEINLKMQELKMVVSPHKLRLRVARSKEDSEKYWTIRRESFNLLRKHVHGRRTAPFVDDVVVQPKFLPEFLPKMRVILDEHKLTYTIAGHAGNGNFHIIPLMDMKEPKNREVIMVVSEKIYDLVAEYHGSITGEHNDGLIRTPFLDKMYSPEILEVFQEVKNIFDPQNIFNPNKKVGATKDYLREHIVRE